jgi:hypothetical protein
MNWSTAVVKEKDCKRFVKLGVHVEGSAIITAYVSPRLAQENGWDTSKPITVTLSQEGGAS